MVMQAGPAVHPTRHDPRWRAIETKDASSDGHFYYSVRTTGVYCLPSCAARLPRPENVAFHPSCAAAEAAGFRPCKRCRPREAPPAERKASLVETLCRVIEASEQEPSLDALAKSVGLSRWHTHRIFKSVTGVTPKQYAASHRRVRMREALRTSTSVTEAIYASGYGSPARFYAAAPKVLGMSTKAYRAGGDKHRIHFAVAECSLGQVLVAATKVGVCAISLGDDPQVLIDELAARFPAATLLGADAGFDCLVAEVVGLVERPQSEVTLPLDIRGTAFQERVWKALMAIPPGQTRSYAELAQALGDPNGARAVAGACAANPLAVAVPCHRVVRRDGGLSGYRWGVERKRKLLDRERSS